MLHLNKSLLYSLYTSLVVLTIVFVFFIGSFQPLYYLLWVIGIGGYIYRNQAKFQAWLQKLPGRPFVRYFSIGIAAILLEEIFASTAMHLMRYLTTGTFYTYLIDVTQFWLVNLLALPGVIIAWYILLRRYAYSYLEIFWLAGIFGLYAEKVHQHVIEFPIFSWALIMPTIFTYGLLILIPVLSLNREVLSTKPATKIIRYTAALLLPVLISIPAVALLSIIYTHAPEAFPPFGFFE